MYSNTQTCFRVFMGAVRQSTTSLYVCKHNCCLSLFSGKENLRDTGYKQEGLVQFVIDSVYSLAHAVHNFLQDNCPRGFKDCPFLKNITGETLLSHIRNVSFIGKQWHIVKEKNSFAWSKSKSKSVFIAPKHVRTCIYTRLFWFGAYKKKTK